MNDTGATAGGPGLAAFVAFLVLAIALWLLMRNMNSRLRRMSYTQRAQDEQVDQVPAAGPDTTVTATKTAPTTEAAPSTEAVTKPDEEEPQAKR